MLSELLFPNQTRRKALAWLCMHPEQSIHLRELARQASAAPGSLKKELDALSHAGLLHSQRVGNQVQFRVNNQHPVFPELQALVRKTIGLTDVLQQALAPLRPHIDLAFVYGSMASGSAHAGSDVDVLLMGRISFAQAVEALHPAQALLGREINPKVMAPAEWAQKRAEGNPFVQDLLAKPRLMLQGELHV
ncbi:nucleotidyltransferase domain-containing protein [Comamonas badia]|uniref:nucleotidyltransferase domain-containing protein n=1 Tax=Comamonas badia TaxID=265291 RepID=UPI00042092E8|nr:nucleotidyltransferase domain-containing protein [Comamonas badia]